MAWLPVLRELHLHGGARLFNGMDPKANLRPNTVSNRGMQITLKSFESLYSEVKKLGLSVIGCDFFHTEESAKGLSPPEWRSKNLASAPSWLCADQGHEWSFIANGAFKQKNGLMYDMASRISHQLRTCEWRLRQLSEAYSDQLTGRIQSKPFKADQRFLDGYTPLCYLALQSFLVDACVLRDYISEFYSEVVIRGSNSEFNKITTLSGLLKKWRNQPPTDSVGREINASAKSGEWLFELGAYRDLVVHVAPLANAGKTLFAVTKTLKLPQGELLPVVKLPLPSNPADLKNQRVTGRYFQDPELTFARFKNIMEDDASNRDALEYAHLCMQQLGALAASISKISPIRPEIPLITQNDIIGNIVISNGVL